MNVIYKIINIRKKEKCEFPYEYIGSKVNYIDGKYWGSSSHPLMIQELKNNPEDFEFCIIQVIDDNDIQCIVNLERQWQVKLNVVNDPKYYNLKLASEKWSSLGFKWAYDPVTLLKAYLPKHKIPFGWKLGQSPTSIQEKVNESKTGFSKGDERLNKIISKRTSAAMPKGKNHRDSKIWNLCDPNGNLHEVILHPFCKENDLSPTAIQYSLISGKPIKKGKSKGWYAMNKI
jgi:hypothetical protein